MNSISDLLKKKADEIDNSGIRTDLDVIQAELDRFFDKQVRVNTFKNGVASVTAKTAPVASNMRLKQTQLVEDLNSSLQNKLDRFIIRIA